MRQIGESYLVQGVSDGVRVSYHVFWGCARELGNVMVKMRLSVMDLGIRGSREMQAGQTLAAPSPFLLASGTYQFWVELKLAQWAVLPTPGEALQTPSKFLSTGNSDLRWCR